MLYFYCVIVELSDKRVNLSPRERDWRVDQKRKKGTSVSIYQLCKLHRSRRPGKSPKLRKFTNTQWQVVDSFGLFDSQEVFFHISSEEFILDSDSENDNLDATDVSEEEDIFGPATDDEEDSECTPSTSASTSSPPIRRRRILTTRRSRKSYRLSTTRSRKTYNWEKSFAGSSPSAFGEESIKNNTKEKAWKHVDAEEMYAFIGLVILMGIIRLPTVDIYWQKKNWILDVPSFNEVMSRKRFRDIWRYLHFCDETLAPSAEDANKDKLHKIRGLLSLILPLFQNSYTPGKEISITETLIPFKGQICFRQVTESKRARFGIKVWALTESSTGYVSRLQFYSGTDPTSNSELSLPSNVVSYLIQPFEGLYHHLYVNHLYTNPELFEDLLSKGVYACGLFRSNSIFFPKDIIAKSTGELARGTSDWRTSGQLLAQSWVDNGALYFLSSIHEPEYEMAHAGKKTVKRKRGRGQKLGSVEVPCPPVVCDYMTHMGGAELSCQIRKYYNMTRRSNIWYRRVFSYLIEVAIHNARVIYQNVSGKRWDGYQFREELITSLIGSYRASRRTSHNTSVPSLPRLCNVGRHFPLPTQTRLACPVCSKKNKMAPAAERTTPSRSRVRCGECNVHLCVSDGKNCFRDWHTKIEYWR
uniref:piggyBac transposable element-derived protein 4-like isoform X2 n=1 Tax=Styela clava TaxID=7725 RepID=UPI001939ECD2|nr:piggyBac transposable element-derived protein 4-like isoform X2 [Styela clava]